MCPFFTNLLFVTRLVVAYFFVTLLFGYALVCASHVTCLVLTYRYLTCLHLTCSYLTCLPLTSLHLTHLHFTHLCITSFFHTCSYFSCLLPSCLLLFCLLVTCLYVSWLYVTHLQSYSPVCTFLVSCSVILHSTFCFLLFWYSVACYWADSVKGDWKQNWRHSSSRVPMTLGTYLLVVGHDTGDLAAREWRRH